MIAYEKEFFQRMCNGDDEAFEYFFNKYYKRLLAYCIEILKDSLSAEEIVEDIYAHIWENRHRIHLEGTPAAYLFRTAYNQCLNHIKHQKVVDKYYSFFKRQLAFAEVESANNSFPLSTLIDKEISERLNQSMERLPNQCRLIFRMSRLEGKKNQEIADDLNISINTVKTQLMRAMNRIRKDMKHYFMVLFFRF